jgi:hypothetical protein
METLEITVNFQLGDSVYCKIYQDFELTIRGYVTRESGATRYLVFHPELGEQELLESELISYREF